jgi:hypothetical protein
MFCSEERLERLKRGPVKHVFDDPEFGRVSEEILENTEDAIEAGIAAAFGESSTNNGGQTSSGGDAAVSSESSDVDSDIDVTCTLWMFDELFSRDNAGRAKGVVTRKRRTPPPEKCLEPILHPVDRGQYKMMKKSRWLEDKVRKLVGREFSDDEEEEDTFVAPPQEKKPKVDEPSTSATHTNGATEDIPKKEKKLKPPPSADGPVIDYGHVDLKSLESIDQLLALPLDHLKQECIRRGLKASVCFDFQLISIFVTAWRFITRTCRTLMDGERFEAEEIS